MDESGNLGGIGSRISEEDPYFILVALVARDEIPINRCIKKVRQTLKKKYRARSELKFKESDVPTKRRILKCIAETNNDINYVFLRKDQPAISIPYLDVDPQMLYNDICMALLRSVIHECDLKGTVDVVIDRFLYGEARAEFNIRLAKSLGTQMHISHLDSRRCPSLQAADFIAGAIARRHRYRDDTFFSIIRHKVTAAFGFPEEIW